MIDPMTQAQWDILFRRSENVYQQLRVLLMGTTLFPAHAGKIIALVQAAEMPDAPRNPGRKDGAGQELYTPKPCNCTTEHAQGCVTLTRLLPKPDLSPEVWKALQEANDSVIAPRLD
jgi:hypothetical protein